MEKLGYQLELGLEWLRLGSLRPELELGLGQLLFLEVFGVGARVHGEPA